MTVPVIEQIETCEWINQLNYYVKNVVTLIVSVIITARVWPFRQWNATHFCGFTTQTFFVSSISFKADKKCKIQPKLIHDE